MFNYLGVLWYSSSACHSVTLSPPSVVSSSSASCVSERVIHSELCIFQLLLSALSLLSFIFPSLFRCSSLQQRGWASYVDEVVPPNATDFHSSINDKCLSWSVKTSSAFYAILVIAWTLFCCEMCFFFFSTSSIIQPGHCFYTFFILDPCSFDTTWIPFADLLLLGLRVQDTVRVRYDMRW